jgi:hypothetical protein
MVRRGEGKEEPSPQPRNLNLNLKAIKQANVRPLTGSVSDVWRRKSKKPRDAFERFSGTTYVRLIPELDSVQLVTRPAVDTQSIC